MNTSYKPKGFQALTPYLIVKDAHQMISYLENAFGAVCTAKHTDDGGKVVHAEVKIDDSILELSEQNERYPGKPFNFHLYVPDVDATHKKAVEAGGTAESEPADMFYGERSSSVIDPFGNSWFIATFQEAISPEEMKKREAAMKKQQG